MRVYDCGDDDFSLLEFEGDFLEEEPEEVVHCSFARKCVKYKKWRKMYGGFENEE